MLTLTHSASDPGLVQTISGPRARRVALSVAGTALIAVAAHVAVPLPFTPVPLTLQPLAVLLVGMLLGPSTAFATMLLYLGEGAAGLPVFSPLGPGGVAQLLGPTGGYLLSYPFAAAAAGWLVRRLPGAAGRFGRGLIAASCATAVILSCGAAWLAVLMHLHLSTTLHLAVLPFLPGEAVKVVAAAVFFRAFVRSRRPQ